MCLPTVVEHINLRRGSNVVWSIHPRATVALAMFPWFVWILWWTLMGQVNGVQFCYEGVCPHPRELDPGREGAGVILRVEINQARCG